MSAEERQRQGRPATVAYGESVKRHLDNFDLEASLNEIAECSGTLLDFSRDYGTRAHHNQRNGTQPQSIPPPQLVDELTQRAHKIHDALARIREIGLQNAAMQEQIKDPAKGAPINSGYPAEGGSYSDDAKGGGGFSGPDGKKRRGRAAPPGRCHSCNRAETPEWRRGPDGARTLCNACGLHYAKLTRKMGANKAIGSSNLRPKGGPGSPQQ
ncbi:GATA-domain-containing protein [Trichodelitschia bisporula]|uniref:GATA-domain-containing protein n=1 Tax=Trichodelitschia bisporula TaxID=703511 RepID=A0A6G1HPN8_9PEZI|nr:GATA-domain-containing protein [Trichodelitschia bisporula]